MKLPAAGWRRDLALAFLLAVVAAAFRLPRLGFPPEEVFDEVYHAKTAQQYLDGEAPTEWVHPPTAKLLIAVGVALFGYESWAWRLAPALAGIAVAPVFFLFARRVLPSERAALLATTLLLADGVYLVQSRIAMTNIFAVLFQLGAALFILRAAREEELPWADMLAAGICLGLALSTRWTSLWATAFLGCTLLAHRRLRIFRVRELLLVAVAFAVLPAALYLLSYLPYMVQQDKSLGFVIEWQRGIWRYHSQLNATHPYFSKWWTWPWLYRPTWYYFNAVDGWTRGIVAIGNPALWWASVPVSIWALARGFWRDPRLAIAGVATCAIGIASFLGGGAGEAMGVLLVIGGLVLLAVARPELRDRAALLAGAGFFALYLPWGISPRQLNFSHYLFEAIPYACLSLGLLLDRIWDGRLRPVAIAYVALVVLLFLLYFPLLTALPVPQDWFNQSLVGRVRLWVWFPTWI
ncbi:MAG: phospholipid carrier-dependent glycosyltransferase [Vicinamibacteria bacterium]